MQLLNKIAFITISFTWLNMHAMETPKEPSFNAMRLDIIKTCDEYNQGLTILSNISSVEGISLFTEKLKNHFEDLRENLLSGVHITSLAVSDEHLNELLNLKKKLLVYPLVKLKKELEILVSSQQYFKKGLSCAAKELITKFEEFDKDITKIIEEKKKEKRKMEADTRIEIAYWGISFTEEEQRYLFSDLLDENNSEITNQLNDLTF